MVKFGARVIQLKGGTIQVLQTRKRGEKQNSPYIVDQDGTKNKERFVKASDDAGLARAVKDALKGELDA